MNNTEKCPVAALAGNPNVGKSTVFNALTGAHQHTGNWAGKTVANAHGTFCCGDARITLVDLPGTYSLRARSREEQAARDFLSSGKADVTVVVVDATCLERNLILLLQVLELTSNVVVCLNLMDEARKKHICIDIPQLEKELGVPVIPCAARKRKGLPELVEAVCSAIHAAPPSKTASIRYPKNIEDAINKTGLPRAKAVAKLIDEVPDGMDARKLDDLLTSSTALRAEEIAVSCVTQNESACARDRQLDRLLMGRRFGIPVMLLLLALVFYITLAGANIPSEWLSGHLLGLSEPFSNCLLNLKIPDAAVSFVVDGIWRVLATVVSVMLPPMAIFFPLFTLLEDSGYLPRVAFQLDHAFQKAKACGKQSLSMCMGFGCNACGVTGCRIIDSPRERLVAMLTNTFAPCNGRFPILIFLCSVFFAGGAIGGSLLLTLAVIGSVILTLMVSRLLSSTVLKGVPSSFALELPPYRAPQIGKVIVRSIFDRTLFVLGRAACVAAPAGAVIWLLANTSAGGVTLLQHLAVFLDPFGRMMGLDGVILLAFVLGFPANELVMPLILMGYMSTGTIAGITDLASFRALLVSNGWTYATAFCVLMFTIAHWPCSTTCITIWKESHSVKWTLVGILLPTAVGVIMCISTASLFRLCGVM